MPTPCALCYCALECAVRVLMSPDTLARWHLGRHTAIAQK